MTRARRPHRRGPALLRAVRPERGDRNEAGSGSVAEARRCVIADPLPQLHVACEFGAGSRPPRRAAAAIASARRGPPVVHRGEPAHDLPALGCPLNRSSSCHPATWHRISVRVRLGRPSPTIRRISRRRHLPRLLLSVISAQIRSANTTMVRGGPADVLPGTRLHCTSAQPAYLIAACARVLVPGGYA